MSDLDLSQQVLLLLAVSIVGVSERVVAWRWLRADTRARGARFAPWAVLSILLPQLGVGAYLPLRPRGRLRECPHCQAPALASRSGCLHCGAAWTGPEPQEQAYLSWRLPGGAAIPLAAMAAPAVVVLTTGLSLYEQILAEPVMKLLAHDGELYVFAESHDRIAKERGMRKR